MNENIGETGISNWIFVRKIINLFKLYLGYLAIFCREIITKSFTTLLIKTETKFTL